MDKSTLQIGSQSEQRACEWLMENGFSIEARNVRYKVGEIDIVAKEGNYLCFVEVRSKKNTQFGTPEETVNWLKQTRLIRAAQTYLKRFYTRQPFCRFDVLAIVGFGPGAEINYYRNAFQVPQEPRRVRKNPWQVY